MHVTANQRKFLFGSMVYNDASSGKDEDFDPWFF